MDDKELFLKKFEEKLKKQLDKKTLKGLSKNNQFDDDLTSVEYEQFRLETLPKGMGWFEKLCNYSQKLLPIKPDKKTQEKLEKLLYQAHLNCSPIGVVSSAMLVSLILIIIGFSITILVTQTIGFGLILVGLGAYLAIQNVPKLLAKRLRAKGNDQVIIAIFYIVAFMRFNSNLELAINFAANYLTAPLSLDFKRLLWEMDNSKYPNIKQALDNYLEDWRDDNLEFLEAIYLIESSLYESEEFRRISLLDKSLDIILQGNYEKMLHFAQELRSKVSAFNMIGVVLPILGLIILPMAASFGDPKSTWEIVFILYNILFPIGVAYFGFMIIFNRPTSVNSIKAPTNIKDFAKLQKFPLKLSKEKTIYLSPKIPAFIIFGIFLFIGLTPFIFNSIGITENLNTVFGSIFEEGSPFASFQEFKIIVDDSGNEYVYGPYGVYPGILSLFIPLSFAFGVGYYLRYKYGQLIHLRDRTKELEKQFPSATFQLGNRINEGISAELSFGAVADTMKGTEAGRFFSMIDRNIKFNGMSVEKSIFDEKKGAINEYPSDLILSSMKILINAIDKGPDITAKTLIDLSKYLSEIHMSNERMKDLLAESLSSMKSQASFLAPIISGVVIAIVSLVTMIMGLLSDATGDLSANDLGSGTTANILGESIPTYLFQSVVGLYIVMLIAILVYMITNLEDGDDPIMTKYSIGEKMIKGMVKYSVIVSFGIILFSFVGAKYLGSIV